MNRNLSESNEAILQLQPTALMILSLKDNMFMLDELLRGKTYPEENGVYLLNQITPILREGVKYFTYEGLNSGIHIKEEEFAKLNEDIYNESGNIIINKEVMKRKDFLLRNKPTVRARVIKIAELLVNEYMNQTSHIFSRRYNVADEIFKHLLPEYQDLYSGGMLAETLDQLFLQISEFIGNDTWHIYFIKLIGSDI